jgi:hypothetical protein
MQLCNDSEARARGSLPGSGCLLNCYGKEGGLLYRIGTAAELRLDTTPALSPVRRLDTVRIK